MELAAKEHYERALKVGMKAIEWNPDNIIPYHRIAPLLLQQGKREEYKSLAKQMLNRFGESATSWKVEQLVKDCFMIPIDFDASERRLLGTLLERLTAERNPSSWSLIALGLARYREADFAAATRIFEEAQAKNSSQAQFGGLLVDMQIGTLRACTSLRLGHEDDALGYLAEAEQAWKEADRLSLANRGIGADDFVRYALFREEANALLSGSVGRD